MNLSEEQYHGFRIEDEADNKIGVLARHWFNVFDENGLAFRVVFGVSWDYAIAVEAPGHPREASRSLAESLGRRWTHGLIDLDRFERGETHEEQRTESSASGEASQSPSDEYLRLALLSALQRMARAQTAGSEIFVLDVDGAADVLAVSGSYLKGILAELLAESLVEPYAATHDSGAVDGSCRITGAGLKHLRAAQARDIAPIPRIEQPRHQPPIGDPCVFISYDTSDLGLAKFVAEIVEARVSEKVFLAKRDIDAGSDPLKTMLEQRLPSAAALLAMCSRASKLSGWLWWEASSVWTRGELVVPLFVDVSANEFGGPMPLVAQGRSVFDVQDLAEALGALVTHLVPGSESVSLTKQEVAALVELERLYDVRVVQADPRREERFTGLLSLILELKDAAFRAQEEDKRWTNEIASIESKLGTALKLLDGEPFPPQVSEYCRAPDVVMVIGQWQWVHAQVEAVLLGDGLG